MLYKRKIETGVVGTSSLPRTKALMDQATDQTQTQTTEVVKNMTISLDSDSASSSPAPQFNDVLKGFIKAGSTLKPEGVSDEKWGSFLETVIKGLSEYAKKNSKQVDEVMDAAKGRLSKRKNDTKVSMIKRALRDPICIPELVECLAGSKRWKPDRSSGGGGAAATADSASSSSSSSSSSAKAPAKRPVYDQSTTDEFMKKRQRLLLDDDDDDEEIMYESSDEEREQEQKRQTYDQSTVDELMKKRQRLLRDDDGGDDEVMYESSDEEQAPARKGETVTSSRGEVVTGKLSDWYILGVKNKKVFKVLMQVAKMKN